MGGTKTGQYLADELRNIADRIHTQAQSKVVDKIVQDAIKAARDAANFGNYHAKVYDDALGNRATDALIIKALEANGFKVKIEEDITYSEHVGEKMMFVEVSWK